MKKIVNDVSLSPLLCYNDTATTTTPYTSDTSTTNNGDYTTNTTNIATYERRILAMLLLLQKVTDNIIWHSHFDTRKLGKKSTTSTSLQKYKYEKRVLTIQINQVK